MTLMGWINVHQTHKFIFSEEMQCCMTHKQVHSAFELAVGTRFQIAMTARVKIKKAKKVVRHLLGYDGMLMRRALFLVLYNALFWISIHNNDEWLRVRRADLWCARRVVQFISLIWGGQLIGSTRICSPNELHHRNVGTALMFVTIAVDWYAALHSCYNYLELSILVQC